MAMHRPSSNAGKPPHNQKRSKEVLEQFVAELADCGNITEAARRTGTGITPWLAYYWRRRSEDGYPGYTIDMGGEDDDGSPLVAEFHEAWDAAIELSADRLEDEADRRGVRGYDEPVIHKGIQAFVRDARTGELELDANNQPIPLTIRRYSDRMLELLLKARRPEKFRENVKIEAEVSGGVLAITGAVLSADDWSAQFAKNEDGKTIDGTAVPVNGAPIGEPVPTTSVRQKLERAQMQKAQRQTPEEEAELAEALLRQNPKPHTLRGAGVYWKDSPLNPINQGPAHPDQYDELDPLA